MAEVGASLEALNSQVAAEETKGQKPFFENLLAPVFAMRRARLDAYVGRDEFLKGVKESSRRETENLQVLLQTDTIAVVRCTVAMLDGQDWNRFDNVRLFVRPAETEEWKLIAWANEPMGKPSVGHRGPIDNETDT